MVMSNRDVAVAAYGKAKNVNGNEVVLMGRRATKAMPHVRQSVGKSNVRKSTKIPASVIIDGKRYSKVTSFYDDPESARYTAGQYKSSGYLAVVKRNDSYYTVYYTKPTLKKTAMRSAPAKKTIKTVRVTNSLTINGIAYKRAQSYRGDEEEADEMASEYKNEGYKAVVRKNGDYYTVYVAKKTGTTRRAKREGSWI